MPTLPQASLSTSARPYAFHSCTDTRGVRTERERGDSDSTDSAHPGAVAQSSDSSSPGGNGALPSVEGAPTALPPSPADSFSRHQETAGEKLWRAVVKIHLHSEPVPFEAGASSKGAKW